MRDEGQGRAEAVAKAIKVEHIGGTGFIDWEATLVNITAALRAERIAALEKVAKAYAALTREDFAVWMDRNMPRRCSDPTHWDEDQDQCSLCTPGEEK